MARSTAKSMTRSATKSATKTKKRVTGSVAPQSLAQVSLSLNDLPDKPKESWSLREAVEQLQDSITIALRRGYRYEEIVEILASCGIRITASSLKRYLSIAKRSNSTAKPRRNTQTQAVQSQAAPASESEPLLDLAAPRRRGRTASATQSTSSVTKIAARAKATPRTTASRKRRKSS